MKRELKVHSNSLKGSVYKHHIVQVSSRQLLSSRTKPFESSLTQRNAHRLETYGDAVKGSKTNSEHEPSSWILAVVPATAANKKSKTFLSSNIMCILLIMANALDVAAAVWYYDNNYHMLWDRSDQNFQQHFASEDFYASWRSLWSYWIASNISKCRVWRLFVL